MKMSYHLAVKTMLIIVFVSMILLGLAYLWHFVPANDYFGVMPAEGTSEENWLRFNELTGWALLFCGFTSLMFLLVTAKKYATTIKLFLYNILTLFITVFLASIGLELVMNFINY